MISIDITLLFQTVNFLVTLFILNVLIVRPIRDVLARRRARNEALAGETSGMQESAAQKMEGYEARMMRTRIQMKAVRDEAKQAAEESARIRLESASEDARAIHQTAAENIRQESEAARKELQGRIAAFAKSAVGRVLDA